MISATNEAVLAKRPAAERFGDLEHPLLDVVTWMSLLDRIVDDITELPRNPLAGDDDDLLTGHLLKVTAVLKRSIDKLYNLYHGREPFRRRPEPDPVLGLVANLSAAWDRLGEALKHTTHFEDHPLVDKAHCEIDAALAELQATPPTTLAGARAAIAWLVEYDKPNVPQTSGEYLRTLIRSPIFVSTEART
jgi:hypothetical protein